MSKKKVAGSTMTLKDFHGGSIPSDLPLPSAPGVVPKTTTDRPPHERAPWGASVGRPDQRTRPSSSHSIRTFDDKSLFLPHTANIGRNFNEDERKPLDGHSAPRRMVSDDVFRVANSRLEVKADSVLTGRHNGWQGAAGPFPGKMNDVTYSVTGTGNGENFVSGTHPNVWTARKEVPVSNIEPGQSLWTTQSPVSNLVHASALEQASSGRWQSKLLVASQMGPDVVKHAELESGGYKANGLVLNQGNEPHGRHAEWGLVTEKIPAPAYSDVREVKIAANSSNRLHTNYSEPRSTGHVVQPAAPSEVVERPKLNLLPRTKPLESVEKPMNDGKQENGASNLIQPESGYATQKSTNILKPGFSADEISNQLVERPKLNLKPLSQLLEQPEVKTEKERNAVFGGARPRELVLRERGIDETEHHEPDQPLDRRVLKPVERVPEQVIPSRQPERPTSAPRDLRTRKFDKKEGRSISDVARSETQRRNWRETDIRSSNNNNNIRQQPTTQEKTRHPSPETWRKPAAASQKPDSPDGSGVRYGKAASALELAQAFSKPFSDPTKSGTGSNNFNMQPRGGVVIGRSQTQQQPFSRLVGSTATATARQINGY